MTTNDQNTFAVAHGNSIEIRKWFQDKLLEDQILTKFHFNIECAATSPTTRYVAAGSTRENGLWIWDASTPDKSPWKLAETETAYIQIAFSRQGNYLAAGGYDDIVQCGWKGFRKSYQLPRDNTTSVAREIFINKTVGELWDLLLKHPSLPRKIVLLKRINSKSEAILIQEKLGQQLGIRVEGD